MKPVRIALAAAVLVTASLGSAAACTVSATALSFGSFGLLTGPVDSTATITVNCPLNTSYTIGLTGLSGTGANARLTDRSNQIGYGLFQDNGHTTPWGDTTSDVKSGTGSGADQPHTVYGRIHTQTSPHVGSYSDTVTITVTY